MRPLAALVLLAAAGLPRTVLAQALEPRCAAETLLQDACQTAADLFTFLTPQLGATVAGGSATLGQSGISGGFGRLSLALRATGLRAELPDLDASPPALGAARQRTIPVRDQLVAFPQLDLSLGLFRGVPLGGTNVGGLDLLLVGAWIPDLREDDFSVNARGSGFRLGAGARLTLLQESFTVPGVAVSFLRRNLPEVGVVAVGDAGADTVRVRDLALRADAWRFTVGKTFYTFGLLLGVGQDRYTSSGALSLAVREGGQEARTATPIDYGRELTRTNAFADLTVPFGGARLVLEAGRVWGGSATTFNAFESTTATAARYYGSLGLRTGF